MKFFSRELSEKLQAMGCKSESDFDYAISLSSGDLFCEEPLYFKKQMLFGESHVNRSPAYEYIQAFSQNDFTGCHKQAWKNAKIAWDNPGDGDLGNNPDGPDIFRHNMIDSDDAEKFLEEFFS